jgi:vacuolar-type H+-ATPase subunit I/STV1
VHECSHPTPLTPSLLVCLQLRGRVSDIVEEYKQLTGQLATLEEASEKTAEELRAAKNVADATLVENRMLQEQLKKMGVEKVEIVSALGSARRKLGESERALAQVQVRGDRVWKGLRMLSED